MCVFCTYAADTGAYEYELFLLFIRVFCIAFILVLLTFNIV